MRRAIAVALLFAIGCVSKPLDDPAIGDDALQAAVRDAITSEPKLMTASIVVSVSHGQVELSGRAETDAQRELAGQVARGVEGVRTVINNIHL